MHQYKLHPVVNIWSIETLVSKKSRNTEKKYGPHIDLII